MGRYIGPKLRKRQLYGLAPEDASIRRRGLKPVRRSAYGERLFEKQKLKFIYGIMEKSMKRYVQEAIKTDNDPQIEVLQRLEMRLDNIVYRLGFAKTREQARQMVSHGHVLVDSKKVDIPSYQLKVGQVVSLHPKLLRKPVFVEKIKELKKELAQLGFLHYSELEGKILSKPAIGDLPKNVDMAKVLEFYSKML